MLVGLLNIPAVQSKLTEVVAQELSEQLQTELSIGKINMGMLNRVILENLDIKDQDKKDLLRVSRLSVRFDILELLKGKISINSVQLFGFDLKLTKQTPEDKLNLQFIIDSFASDQPNKEPQINLRINSLLVRRGKFSYDVASADRTEDKFNPEHVQLNNIIANISLKALQNDSINAHIKRLSATETSGVDLKKLSLKVVGNRKKMAVENFEVNLPNSKLEIDTIKLNFENIKSLEEFNDQVYLSLHTLPSYITLQDLSAFVPAFKNFKERIDFGIDIDGTINQLNCSQIYLNADQHIYLHGTGNIDGLTSLKDAFIQAKLSRLSVDEQGMDFLLRNFIGDYQGLPPILYRLGTTSFRGELTGYINDFVTYGLLKSNAGIINTDIRLKTDRDKGLLQYNGRIRSKALDLKTISGNNNFGTIDFNFDIDGLRQRDEDYPRVKLLGNINHFDFNEYNYDEINIDGLYEHGGFDGKLSLEDRNAQVQLDGSFNLALPIPTFNFKAKIENVRPYELNISKRDKDALFSVDVVADFTGFTIDQLNGEINVNDLNYTTKLLKYDLDNFKIKAEHNEKENHLIIDSKFLKAQLNGQYSYGTLWGSIYNITKKYLPSLTASLKTPKQSPNNFNFNIEVLDTKIFTHFLNIPLETFAKSYVQGYLDDDKGKVHVEGYFPRLRYGNNFYESAMLLFENSDSDLRGQIRFTQQKKAGAVTLSLVADASNDKIKTSLNWGNDGLATYSGKFNSITHFEFQNKENSKKKYLKTDINILKSNVILNDTLWQISPSSIQIGDKSIEVKDFLFSNDQQFAQIDGKISTLEQDTLHVELNDIDLGYIFDMVNIANTVDFKGKTTGTVVASQLFTEPMMEATLHVNRFSFNDGIMGDMGLYAYWNNKTKGIFVDAEMNENDLGMTGVTGYIYPIPPNGGLDLKISAMGTNIKFLEGYMKGIASDIKGRAYGGVRLHGPFSELNLEGNLYTDASLHINVLNTAFHVGDSLRFTSEGINFKDVKISDKDGHNGRLNGALKYQHFKNLNYNFSVNANNLLVMNTKESEDMPFFGKVYSSGNVNIAGNANGLNVNAAMRTEANSNFTFIINSTASAANNQFIHFNDLTPSRHAKDSLHMNLSDYIHKYNNEDDFDSEIDIRLNLQIEATPNANIKVIVDPISGDYLTAVGNGNIRLDFFNKGEVKLFGNYAITKGNYKFSLQEVIRKDFTIKPGSNISFNGSPMEAMLDIHTQYMVNSVSLNDLIPQENLVTSRPHIKVNCLMNLSGQLTNPNITFDLELPSERDEVRSLVRNLISTEEQINMQVLYLLGIGKFYTSDNSQSSDMMSSVLSSTLSGQLNNMLSEMVNNNNWSIGTNVSTGNKGWTDVEVEGMLSAQLLNNRLLINGNLGYRENPLTNSNFIGDFEAELLLNRSGNIRLRAYSKTNDRYLTRTNLTTQGIGIMFRRDFIFWRELLFWNNIKKRRKIKEEIKAEQIEEQNQSREDQSNNN